MNRSGNQRLPLINVQNKKKNENSNLNKLGHKSIDQNGKYIII